MLSPSTDAVPPRTRPNGRGCGSRLGCVLATAAMIAVVGLLLLPVTRAAPEASRRSVCANNIKRIGAAILAYTEEHGALPPAYTVDALGRPLHSWRVLILPYLDQIKDTGIDLDKPWDDPANAAALRATPDVYRCPGARVQEGTTTYHLVVSPGGLVRPDGSASLERLRSAEGATVLVVEGTVDRAVGWTSPFDHGAEVLASFRTGPHRGLMNTLQADGSVRSVMIDRLPNEVRWALVTPSADDPPGTEEQ